MWVQVFIPTKQKPYLIGLGRFTDSYQYISININDGVASIGKVRIG